MTISPRSRARRFPTLMLVGLATLTAHIPLAWGQPVLPAVETPLPAGVEPGDRFGWSAAMSGELLVIGAPGDDDACGIDPASNCCSTGHGPGCDDPEIEACVCELAPWCCAISWDACVTAPIPACASCDCNAGAVLVYRKAGGAWTLEAKLTPADEVLPASFGDAVAVNGDTIAVSAYSSYVGHITSTYGLGRVYIFRLTGGPGESWTQEAVIDLADAGLYGAQEMALALSGDRVVVGVPQQGTGQVRVYRRNGPAPGPWVLEQTLSDIPSSGPLKFGDAVAIEGNRIVVGSPSRYSAFVFEHEGGVWTRRAVLSQPSSYQAAGFGKAAALSGDTLIVGAPDAADVAVPVGGAAYLYQLNAGEWTQRARWTSPASSGQDNFGSSVAVSGNLAVVGSWLAFPECKLTQSYGWQSCTTGSAWAYRVRQTGWELLAELPAYEGQVGWLQGVSIATNGDDVATGAHLGINPHGPMSVHPVRAFGGLADRNGNGLADALDEDCLAASAGPWCDELDPGDLNRDGRLDPQDPAMLARCATPPCPDGTCNPPLYASEACVLADTDRDGDVDLRDVVRVQQTPWELFCSSPADFAMTLSLPGYGAPLAAAEHTFAIGYYQLWGSCSVSTACAAGSVLLYSFDGQSWIGPQTLTAIDTTDGDGFGAALAMWKDMLVVSAPGDDDAGLSSGSVYVFRNQGGQWLQEAKLIPSAGATNSRFGSYLAFDGDRIAVGSHGFLGATAIFRRNGTAWVEEAVIHPAEDDGPLRKYFEFRKSGSAEVCWSSAAKRRTTAACLSTDSMASPGGLTQTLNPLVAPMSSTSAIPSL